MTRLQTWIQCPDCENIFKRSYYLKTHRSECKSKKNKKKLKTIGLIPVDDVKEVESKEIIQ